LPQCRVTSAVLIALAALTTLPASALRIGLVLLTRVLLLAAALLAALSALLAGLI
jgi:hypothetical protein